MSATAQRTYKNDRKSDQGFKHILVATDLSTASERAFSYAAAIARQYGARLSVLHVLPPDPLEPAPIYPLPRELDRDRLEAERQLQLIAEKIEDLDHRLLLQKGPLWSVLASAIQHENVDLLVLGTRGRDGLKKVALGSVAEAVFRQAECPVLTVGPNVPRADPHHEFQRILFATDFGPASDKALPYALSLAESYRARLIVLHLLPPMPIPDVGPAAYCPGTYICDDLVKWQKAVRQESEKKLKALISAEHKLAAEPEYVIGLDLLPEGILEVAAKHNIGLIVMGVNRTRSPRVAAHIPWAIAHEVLCRAHCPVLTISNGEKAEELSHGLSK